MHNNEHEVELLEEAPIWHSREVKYLRGRFKNIVDHIPYFELRDFVGEDNDVINPYYKTVVRLPLTPLEKAIPVGIVSNTYTLAQHRDVASLCIDSIRKFGIEIESLDCELGMSVLGEWMNFRIYFPPKYSFTAIDENSLKLRLECFNSVDGSSRLVILFGWYRFVCSNGMVIGETISELRDIHNRNMDIGKIETIISKAMNQVSRDKDLMISWQETPVNEDNLTAWVDSNIANRWGKKSAFRVFNICMSGHDAKYADPFEAESPSQKAAIQLGPVPGSPTKTKNLYDVSQVLSWIATNRTNAEEKTKWQGEIPQLINDYCEIACH